MAELKPFEAIVQITAVNDKGELCFCAEKIERFVRCKDCKYGYVVTEEVRKPEFNRCEVLCTISGGMRLNDYCSYGERNDDD